MTCNPPKHSLKNNVLLLAMTVLLSAGMGCQKPTTNTTEPSTTFEPQVQNRNWPQQFAYYQPVAVEHETLYLAGPFEQSGGDGLYDEIKAEDLWAVLLCPAAFLGNVATLPGAVILTPPTQPQHSRSVFPLEAPAYEPLVLQSDQYQN